MLRCGNSSHVQIEFALKWDFSARDKDRPCFVVKLRERCEVREAATATKRNVVKRSEEAGAIAEH